MKKRQILNYIDAQFVAAASGGVLDNYEPATGAPYSQLPDSDSSDVDCAVAAAAAAFPAWAETPADTRAELLFSLARRIEENADRLAEAESIDSGKPRTLARAVDIPRAALNFRFFANAVTQFSSECHSQGGIALNYTLREPLGVVGCISPWNLPLYLLTWKIAPALAAGNCVVAKPSELTPMTAFLLCELAQEVGFPRGVLNVVHGVGAKAGEAIIRHAEIKAVSFTGGTATGRHIASVAAPQFKKISLELGGKNPTIVFADCDFHEAVRTAVRASFLNQGEICLCGSRVLVEAPLYDRFRDAFVAEAARLAVGDPLREGTDQGALVSEAHMQKVLGAIARARAEGGKIVTGGLRVNVPGRCEQGWFVAPTVIEGLSPDCRTNQEEIFGPVASIGSFESEQEALAMANGTAYGLSASIWTENVSRAHRVARELDAGVVWVNCWLQRDLRTPFGGVKQSGVGREGGLEALRFFTEPKNVCVRIQS